jgi:hypothetical protein
LAYRRASLAQEKTPAPTRPVRRCGSPAIVPAETPGIPLKVKAPQRPRRPRKAKTTKKKPDTKKTKKPQKPKVEE